MKSKRQSYGDGGMFGWEFEIKDMSEEIKAAAKEQILEGLIRIGLKMAEFARNLCPVDTGALRQSIQFEVDPDEPSVTLGTNKEYAPYVELGTGEYSEVGGTPEKRWVYRDELTGETRVGIPQKPRHFIRPAVADHEDTYKAIMSDALSDGD